MRRNCLVLQLSRVCVQPNMTQTQSYAAQLNEHLCMCTTLFDKLQARTALFEGFVLVDSLTDNRRTNRGRQANAKTRRRYGRCRRISASDQQVSQWRIFLA